MSFNWTSRKADPGFASIYDSNITLNKSASGYFETANKILLGFDSNNLLIAVKPLSKENVDIGLYPEDQMFNISVTSSYAKISNKEFIKQVLMYVNLDLSENKFVKFITSWDNNEEALIIDLKQEV